jgi:hypothetical protein
MSLFDCHSPLPILPITCAMGDFFIKSICTHVWNCWKVFVYLTILATLKSFKMLNFGHQRDNILIFNALFNNFSLVLMLIIVI